MLRTALLPGLAALVVGCVAFPVAEAPTATGVTTGGRPIAGAWVGVRHDPVLAEPSPPAEAEAATDDSLRDVLEARSLLGFGANCRGPVLDLALAPDGRRAAFSVRDLRGLQVYGVDLDDPPRTRPVARASLLPERRLVWTVFGALAMDAAAEEGRPRTPEIVWKPPSQPPPAAPDRGMPRAAEASAPWAGRHDERASHTRGRSFVVKRALDPATGGVRERLDVTEADGRIRRIPLPGEACSPAGRFEQPQERLTADGRHVLDLRWIDGGCHALRIDLADGAWSKLDAAVTAGVCREDRRLPLSLLERALHAYLEAIEARLAEAKLERSGSFSLWLGPGSTTRLETRGGAGEPHWVDLASFPLPTPLRRIQVTPAGAAAGASSPDSATQSWQPL